MQPKVGPVREALAPDSHGAVAPGWSGSAEEERAMFDAILAGDARLADSIYLRLVPPIDSTLQRLLGGRHPDHEELVDRSLRRVIFEISRQPVPWVCTLTTWAHAGAAQIALDVLRVSPRPARSAEPDPKEPLRPTPVACASRSLQPLRVLLSELTPPQAEVVVLHHLLGFGLSHVAITTGTSLESVVHRLAHGQQKLAAGMQKPGAPSAGAMQLA
jgi:DNA-directed RNA polymerase specialized sigma24 family protein